MDCHPAIIKLKSTGRIPWTQNHQCAGTNPVPYSSRTSQAAGILCKTACFSTCQTWFCCLQLGAWRTLEIVCASNPLWIWKRRITPCSRSIQTSKCQFRGPLEYSSAILLLLPILKCPCPLELPSSLHTFLPL